MKCPDCGGYTYYDAKAETWRCLKCTREVTSSLKKETDDG